MRLKIALLLVLGLSGVSYARASGPRGWSVDLKKYGYQNWLTTRGIQNSSQLCLAYARDVVAVGLGNPVSKTPDNERSGGLPGANWEISLLLFDPNTGRLNAKRGPWTGDEFFELFSTSRGNLLLLVRHFNGAAAEMGETLYLLSATGDEVKKLFLAPSIIKSKQTWNTILISSSGRSVLVGQTLENGEHYKLLEADTLEIKSEWIAKIGANWHPILALSDREMLGLGAPKASRKTGAVDGGPGFYVRTFDGTWIPFPATLDASHHGVALGLGPNQLAFLSDDTIVGVERNQEAAAPSIIVLRIDGTKVFSPIIPNLAANTSFSGPVNVSQDGHYFAVGFTHRPWLSHLMLDVWQLDDTFQNDELELVVWASSSPTALEQVNLGSDVNVRSLSLALNDPLSVVFLEGSTLKAIPIQPRR